MGAAAPIIGTGLAVVGGISQANQRRKQANADKKQLENASRQAAMQAELQLFGLENNIRQVRAQASLAKMQQDLSYQTAESQLALEEIVRQQQTAQDLVSLKNQQAQIDIQSQLDATRVDQQRQSSREKISQGTTEQLGQLTQGLQALQGEQAKGVPTQDSATIAMLADLISTAGGVNEAISLLGENLGVNFDNMGTEAERASSFNQLMSQLLMSQEQSALGIVDTEAGLSKQGMALDTTEKKRQLSQARENVTQDDISGDYARQATRLAMDSQRQTNNRFAALNEQVAEADYQANKDAVSKGLTLQQSNIDLSRGLISSPSVFDYLAVGVGGYNTYQQLQGSRSMSRQTTPAVDPSRVGSWSVMRRNDLQQTPSPMNRGVDLTGALYNYG